MAGKEGYTSTQVTRFLMIAITDTPQQETLSSFIPCFHGNLRRCPLFFETQLIGAYGAQWVPWSFEGRVCFRIIMSFI